MRSDPLALRDKTRDSLHFLCGKKMKQKKPPAARGGIAHPAAHILNTTIIRVGASSFVYHGSLLLICRRRGQGKVFALISAEMRPFISAEEEHP